MSVSVSVWNGKMSIGIEFRFEDIRIGEVSPLPWPVCNAQKFGLILLNKLKDSNWETHDFFRRHDTKLYFPNWPLQGCRSWELNIGHLDKILIDEKFSNNGITWAWRIELELPILKILIGWKVVFERRKRRMEGFERVVCKGKEGIYLFFSNLNSETEKKR